VDLDLVSAPAAKPVKAGKAPKAGRKPNVHFNNFEERSTYEAVAELAKNFAEHEKRMRETAAHVLGQAQS
jgi:hypothetical protein